MKTNPSTGRVNPYPAYKPSGVPWLSDVPEHWQVHKLRNILKASNERNRPDLPLLSVVRERGTILRDVANMEENHNFIPDDLTNYKVVKDGQFAMNKMKAWQGSYGVSQHDGIVSPAYFVFDLRRVAGNYFHKAIRSQAYVPFFTQASDGVRIGQWDLSQTGMREIPLLVPPPPEQAAIVRYLDHADRRIRRYVSAKRKLIALLEEEKQAIINRAVTRGLDPNVRLKPSGVEWLGDVPEHWEIRRLRQCVSISGGMTPSMEVRRFWDGLVPWVTPKDMKQAVICGSSVKITDAAISETSLQLIEPPVVLMVVRGMILARRVPIAYTTVPVTINQDMKAMRAVKGTSARFLAHSLDSAQKAFIPLIDEAGHGTRRLPTERWRELLIAMPPPSEQSAIVDYIDKATTVGEAAIARARRQLELVQEYRTRFIADVVTGKLDVREAAVLLPDETDEESMDEGGPLADNMNDGPYGASQPTEEVLALESEVSA